MAVTFRIECDTKQDRKAAKEFLGWLSNSGEQDYWNAMEKHPTKPVLTLFEYDYEHGLEFSAVLKTELTAE